jgi:hypothetical protein
VIDLIARKENIDGIYNPQVKLGGNSTYEITWQCRDNCD